MNRTTMRVFSLICFLFIGIVTQSARAHISAIWAQDGLDKVTQEELRGSAPRNSTWDGTNIHLFSAQNETVSFALIIESANEPTHRLSVRFSSMKDTKGRTIQNRPLEFLSNDKRELFDFTRRPIEGFYVRYLKVHGTSALFYDTYDERHVPQSLRRLHNSQGIGSGTWKDRPKHDQSFPEILVPLELHRTFDIEANKSQMIWFDVTVSKTTPPGLYTGEIEIREGKSFSRRIPVQLEVAGFSLPDEPTLKTMVYLGYSDVALRYTGTAWPLPGSKEERETELIRDRHFQIAHRHRLSLIDANQSGASVGAMQPLPAWRARLSGTLFTSVYGYTGAGTGVGNGVFAIGTYGQWDWKDAGESGMHEKLNAWGKWFQENSPKTEVFLYLIDESEQYEKIEHWSRWIKNNSGPGRRILSFATFPLTKALEKTPSLDIAATWFTVGEAAPWQRAIEKARSLKKPLYFYNGKRPGTPSFATEDDGIALRALAWIQYKQRIDRWFYWESTYYNDYQAGRGQINVFETAHTYGRSDRHDDIKGETGWNYSNGDGVLFYPGTDTVFTNASYNAMGPFVSLRMKSWRRGIQDADYLALANQKDSSRVNRIISRFVPRTLWENGVSDPKDPTWVRCAVGWIEDHRPWEDARRELSQIIVGNPSEESRPSSLTKATSLENSSSDQSHNTSYFQKLKNAAVRILNWFRNI